MASEEPVNPRKNVEKKDGDILSPTTWKRPYIEAVFLLMVAPYLLEKIMQHYGVWRFANIASSDWLTYGGTLFGAYVTIVALVGTIRESRRMTSEQNKFSRDLMFEQEKLQSLPVLYFQYRVPTEQELIDNYYNSYNHSNVNMYRMELGLSENDIQDNLFWFQIRNIGVGPAVDVSIEISHPLELGFDVKFYNVIPQSDNYGFVLVASAKKDEIKEKENNEYECLLIATYKDIADNSYKFSVKLTFYFAPFIVSIIKVEDMKNERAI